MSSANCKGYGSARRSDLGRPAVARNWVASVRRSPIPTHSPTPYVTSGDDIQPVYQKGAGPVLAYSDIAKCGP